jgi:hypothetical protein
MATSPESGTMLSRLVYVPKTDGPHVRLGLLWFVGAVVACAIGPIAVAFLFSSLATVSALQTSRVWMRRGREVDWLVATIGSAAVVLAAQLGAALAGLALLGMVASSLIAAKVAPARSDEVFARAGRTLRSGAVAAVAAASVVILARTDMGALVVLLVLVSVYEVGDYLVGTGSNLPIEGPVAGIAAVLVLTFTESVFQLGPFEAQATWVFGGMVAVGAPLGAVVGSAIAPGADAAGPALRRLDAWLITAPAWCWMLWGYLN